MTFAVSLLERVIEEQARGDKSRAAALRGEILDLIGTDLSELVPGSETAMKVKAALIEKGVWSQYLEVGIGPEVEIFTQAQPMSPVGDGAEVGLCPISSWNNPEPEVALRFLFAIAQLLRFLVSAAPLAEPAETRRPAHEALFNPSRHVPWGAGVLWQRLRHGANILTAGGI